MTLALCGKEVADKLNQQFPSSVLESNEDSISAESGALLELISFLKTNPDFDFNYLSSMTAVDYLDYFELVYHLTSMEHNHSLVVKTRCYGRENLVVPSIVSLYQGANSQEREIYDLMGIRFEGHPDLRRIFLWDNFQGHPLRKDYL